MAVCETHLDTTDLYNTALESLMDSLHINSASNLESTLSNNSSVDEEKCLSFCSTIEQHPTTASNSCQQNDLDETHTQSIIETPKRPVGITRKQKLFKSAESLEGLKSKSRTFTSDKNLSPQSFLLKKAMARYECMQRRQERKTFSKKPMRTSLRI